MPKPLRRQAKGLVVSLIDYFERECQNGGPLLPLESVRERVADALKLSLLSVNRLSAKAKAGQLLASPSKQHPRNKPTTEINPSQQAEVQNVIYEMYQQKKPVTLSTLAIKLKDRCLYTGSSSSLWRILRNIGFKWQKDNPRRGLMELSRIASKQITFLKAYLQYRESDLFQFVFLDETWIFQDRTIGRSWQNDSIKSVRRTKVEGKRYIGLHAGNRQGFVDGAELIFSSSTKHADYYGEMNAENVIQWFENQVLRNLKEPPVIVMDNAPYHSLVKNKAPISSSKKKDIQQWLTINDVCFKMNMLKPQLLQKVAE